MHNNRKWFMVYTRPGQERKLSDHLTRKRFENYCPLNTVMRPAIDRKKPIQEPLFGSHLFVRIGETQIPDLLATYGVVGLVYWLGKLAVISEQDIAAMKKFIGEHATVHLERTGINGDVDVKRNKNFSYLRNEFPTPIEKDKLVTLILPSLGYLMMAESKTVNTEVLLRNLA